MERKLLITCARFSAVFIAALNLTAVKADEGDLSAAKQLVAEAFRYPVSQLQAKLTTDEARSRHGSAVSFAAQFTSTNNTFYPTSIGVGKRGSLLAPRFEAQITEAIAKTEQTKGNKQGVRKIALANQGYALVGLGAFGPGGGESLTYVVLPSQQLEVAIKVVVPGEDLVDIEAAPAEYRTLVADGNPDMVGRITHLAEQVAALTEAPTDPHQSGSSTTSQSSGPDIKQSQPPAPKQAPEAKPSPTPSEEPASSTPWAIIVVLIVAALGLLWLLLKRRS